MITGSSIVDVDKLYEKSLVTLEDGRLIEADAVIIAAGLSPYEPKERTGRRILASLDYDRLIDQRNDPLPEDLKKVAFVLCVGSRCLEYPLCSADVLFVYLEGDKMDLSERDIAAHYCFLQ